MKNLIIILCIVWSSFLFAQSVNLDSVQINATHISTSIKESGKNVTIISHEEISQLPIQSVDELLRSIAGININSRNGFGVQADIGMRGSTFSQVLILVDNIRLNDPLTAHFNNNIPVALAEIDHIEIIRGTASASFGADAVGGVIHIKTKTYVNKKSNDFVNFVGNIGFGQHNTSLSDIGIVGKKGKLSYSSSIKTSISDGETLINPNFGKIASADSLFSNYFDLKTYSGAVNYQINEVWSAYARIGYDDRKFNAKYFYTRSSYDESREKTNSIWSQFAIKRNKRNHHSELNIGYKKGNDTFIFNPLFGENHHTTELLSMRLHHDFLLHSKIKLAIGTQLENKTIESNDRGNHKNASLGIYGLMHYNMLSNLHSTLGLRLQNDANFGTKFLPQLNVSYIQNKFVLRTSIGKGIRAADFTERYISSQISSLSPGRNIGNPDLKAEESYNFDLGTDIYPLEDLTISATGFYRFSNNLIDYVLTNSNDISNATNLQVNSDYLYARNIVETQTYGLEFSANKKLKIKNNSLDIRLDYTFLKTNNGEDIISKYVANHPNHNVGFNLFFKSKYFDISTTTHYIHRDGVSIDEYFFVSEKYSVTHLKLNFHPWTQTFGIYFQIQNVFDTEYQEILGAKMPRRWSVLGVNWH